jgi:hypothetical protein
MRLSSNLNLTVKLVSNLKIAMKNRTKNNMKNTKNPNVRFWFYWRGWVRLTLTPDKAINLYRYERTDEGHSYEQSTLLLSWDDKNGWVIYDEWESGGRDCDGPISHRGKCWCPVQSRAVIPAYVDQGLNLPGWLHEDKNCFQGLLIHRPDWQRGPVRVYDAYAEAMNY